MSNSISHLRYSVRSLRLCAMLSVYLTTMLDGNLTHRPGPIENRYEERLSEGVAKPMCKILRSTVRGTCSINHEACQVGIRAESNHIIIPSIWKGTLT